MVEIFVNNELVDSYGDVSAPLTFSIADISNPEKRNSSFSKSIKLPSTPTNDRVFTYIYEINGVISSTDDTINYTPDFNPNLKTSCEVYIDSMLQFKGSIQLLQINNDKGKYEYECYLLGELKNIFLDWGEDELTDLDLDEYIHDWTYQNVVNSWNNAKTISSVDGSITTATNTATYEIGEGFVYPLIDFGINSFDNSTGNDPNVFEVRAFRPAFYVKTLIDKMFSSQGYSYTSTFFDSERFKRLIIPSPITDFKLTEEEKEERKVRAVNDTEYSFTTSYSDAFQLPNLTDVAPTLGAVDINNQWDNINKYITVDKAGSYKLNTLMIVSISSGTTYSSSLSTAFKRAKPITGVTTNVTNTGFSSSIGNVDVMKYSVVITDSGTGQTIYDDGAGNLIGDVGAGTNILTTTQTGTPIDYGNGAQLIGAYTFAAATTGTITLSYFYNYNYQLNINVGGELWSTTPKQYFASRDVFFDEGDRVYQFMNVGTGFQTTTATIHVGSYFEMSANGNFVEGSTLYPQVWLPQKVKQKDFFKSILNMFNLYVEQTGEKTMNIVPRTDFYTSTGAVDWTLKLDHSKQIDIKPLGELGANEYLYTYKKDVDLYNEKYSKDNNQEIYGQKLIKIVNDFKVKQQKTEVIFSNSPIVGSSINAWKYPRIVKENQNTGDYEPFDHNIRIMYYGGMVQMGSDNKWNIYSISGQPDEGFHEFTKYPYAGHLDNPYQPLFDLCFGKPREVYWSNAIYTDNNLYNIYHKKFIEEITDKDSKILTAYFRLNPLDIFELDFRKYVFIDGAYYILQKISDYDFNRNEVTKVELLKIKSGTPYTETTIPVVWDGGVSVSDVETIEGGEDENRDIAADSEFTIVEGGEDEVRYSPADTDIIIVNGSGGADYTTSTILVP